MENAWRTDRLNAPLRIARAWAAMVVVALGVGGCADTKAFTEILEEINRTLTAIAVLKKGGG